MSNLRITFTDPATRRNISLDAQRSTETPQNNDGFVDLGLDGFDGSLRIPTADLSKSETAALKRAIANPDAAAMNVMDMLAGSTAAVMVRSSDLGSEVADHIAPGLPGANLDASGARRPVSFSGGRFSAELGQRPESSQAIGEGLYAAAKLIDDAPGNAIEAMALGAKQRNELLSSLKTDLSAAAVGKTTEGLSDTQTLQLRSSASTVLLELLSAKGSKPELRQEALQTYVATMEAENNPVLRDSMGWNLRRVAPELPREMHQVVGESLAKVRSESPPYEAWFKDGDNTLTVDWSAGSESLGDDKKRLIKEGFVEVGQDDGTILEKTYKVGGDQDTTFRVRLRSFRSDMFKRVDDKDTDMVIYTGHSNWGRNMRDSLEGLGSEVGGKDKLVLSDLCVGKGEMQQFKDKFPNADLVTTHNSSYFIPGAPGREASSEGINTILATFEGIAYRAPYADIAREVRANNPWTSLHAGNGVDNNFIFPGDEIVRRRVLDRDHDGQADILDRVVDFNSFKPKTDAARDFEPIAGRPAAIQDGTKAHFAAMTVTRLGCYSQQFDSFTKDGRVIPGGMFDPKPGETAMFRFAKGEVEGRESITMTMNAHYAHSSEEALRAGASYEFARFVEGDSGDPVNNRLNALIFASHSLHTDVSRRDKEVWSALLTAKGLPDIKRSDVESSKGADHDYYSGSEAASKSLRGKLDDATLAALAKVS